MLIAHVCVPAFLVVGQIVILIGGAFGVPWVRNVWFRLAHIGLIGFIAVQTLIGRVCPLTQLEQALREGAPWGSQTAVQRWLDPLLFCNAPGWVFTAVHSLAALVIILTWFAVPPDWSASPFQPKRAPDALEI